jgi:CobQ-like glutamine amidotransferase family enzyme
MNLYADTGNVIAVRRRLDWMGHTCDVKPVHPGEPFDFTGVDMVIGGGGPDASQRIVSQDLALRAESVHAALRQGVPMLLVCGLYQLFGTSFATPDGDVLPGIGIFDAVSVSGSVRCIGDIVVSSPHGQLTGYENHAGVTHLGSRQAPLGRVLRGKGNNSRGRTEGAVTGSAIGTYLHGPVLPRNPALADHMIHQAIRRHELSARL